MTHKRKMHREEASLRMSAGRMMFSVVHPASAVERHPDRGEAALEQWLE